MEPIELNYADPNLTWSRYHSLQPFHGSQHFLAPSDSWEIFVIDIFGEKLGKVRFVLPLGLVAPLGEQGFTSQWVNQLALWTETFGDRTP